MVPRIPRRRFDGHRRQYSQGFEEPDDVSGIDQLAEILVVLMRGLRESPLVAQTFQ